MRVTAPSANCGSAGALATIWRAERLVFALLGGGRAVGPVERGDQDEGEREQGQCLADTV